MLERQSQSPRDEHRGGADRTAEEGGGGALADNPCHVRGGSEDDALNALQALARTGAVRRIGGAANDGRGTGGPSEVSLVQRFGVRAHPEWTRAERLRGNARVKLAAVDRYARSRHCRRQTLLAYFGEEAPLRCGACDRCRDRRDTKRP